jgi:hypothetical protein
VCKIDGQHLCTLHKIGENQLEKWLSENVEKSKCHKRPLLQCNKQTDILFYKASNSFRTEKGFKTVFCKASEKLLEYIKTKQQVSQIKFDIHTLVCWFYHLM